MPIVNSQTCNSSLDKFGRVFVQQKTDVEDGHNLKSEHKFDVVNDVCFSNFKLRIHRDGSDQEVSSYNGRNFSVGIFGHKLLLPITLGENPTADLESCDAAVELDIKYAKEIKLIDEDARQEEVKRKCELIRKSRLSLFLALSNPRKNILKQQFLLKLAAPVYFDDMMESIDFGGSSGALVKDENETIFSIGNIVTYRPPYKLTSRIAWVLSQAVCDEDLEKDPFDKWIVDPFSLLTDVSKAGSNTESADHILKGIPEENYGEIYGIVRMLLEFASMARKEVLNAGKRNSTSYWPVLNYVQETLETFLFECTEDWQEKIMKSGQEMTMLPTMKDLHNKTILAGQTIEAILLQDGIEISSQIRKTVCFRRILDLSSIHMRNVNNLVSADREIGCTWKNNEICVLVKSGGWNLKDAQRKAVLEANSTIKQLNVLLAQIIEIAEGTEEENQVRAFVFTVKQVIVGNVQWVALSQRYCGFTLDCYIE